MNNNLSILFLTDNTLDEKIANFCKWDLWSKVSNNDNDLFLPVICVSQKSVIFNNWENICVGEIGRSWKSLYTQILAGLDACETEHVGIAEHDCLIIPEHWGFVPPDDKFYYNKNHWMVDWNTGEYFRVPLRKAMSQLICRKDIYKEFIEGMLDFIEKGISTESGLRWYGEPGLASNKYKEYFRRSGISEALKKEFIYFVDKFESQFFETEYPNLDIRHSANFTGKKKGREYCMEIPYWSKFSEVINA